MELNKFTDSEIIKVYSNAIKELKNRNIIRTKNITGELGEYIAVNYYNNTANLPNLILVGEGTENVDAFSRKGERYSIKTITTKGSTGVFYGLPKKGSNEVPEKKFEYVLLVKLTDDFELENILEFTWDEFLSFKQWHSRMEAWNLPYTNKVIESVKNVFKK